MYLRGYKLWACAVPLIRHLNMFAHRQCSMHFAKARRKGSDKRRTEHSISAIVFFKTSIVCWSNAHGSFWMSPLFFIPFFIKAMQTSLGRERFAQNYYDFCFDFHIAASCRLGIFPLIFVGAEPGTELGRVSLQTQRIRSNILSDVVNVRAILQQGFHKMSCFSRGHLSPYVSVVS